MYKLCISHCTYDRVRTIFGLTENFLTHTKIAISILRHRNSYAVLFVPSVCRNGDAKKLKWTVRRGLLVFSDNVLSIVSATCAFTICIRKLLLVVVPFVFFLFGVWWARLHSFNILLVMLWCANTCRPLLLRCTRFSISSGQNMGIDKNLQSTSNMFVAVGAIIYCSEQWVRILTIIVREFLSHAQSTMPVSVCTLFFRENFVAKSINFKSDK